MIDEVDEADNDVESRERCDRALHTDVLSHRMSSERGAP